MKRAEQASKLDREDRRSGASTANLGCLARGCSNGSLVPFDERGTQALDETTQRSRMDRWAERRRGQQG